MDPQTLIAKAREWAGVIRDMRDTRNLAFLRGRQWVR